MTQKLKAAVIGVGHLGKFHAQKYAQSNLCDLVAVVDADLSTAQTIADQFENCQAFDNYQSILEQLDVVSLVVPTSLHFEIAKDLLNNNIHLLIEKPITETVEEAQELIDIARKNNLAIQVGHIERFNPVIIDLDEHLDEPLFIESTRLAPFKPRATDVSVILDLMIHDIDIILNLVKSPISSLSASGIQVLSEAIDIANARIEFENGCVANVTASRISRKSERKLRIFQKDASISADFQDKVLSINAKGSGESFPGFSNIEHHEKSYEDNDALNQEIIAFLEAVTNKTEPPVTGEDGKRALQTAIEISALILNK